MSENVVQQQQLRASFGRKQFAMRNYAIQPNVCSTEGAKKQKKSERILSHKKASSVFMSVKKTQLKCVCPAEKTLPTLEFDVRASSDPLLKEWVSTRNLQNSFMWSPPSSLSLQQCKSGHNTTQLSHLLWWWLPGTEHIWIDSSTFSRPTSRPGSRPREIIICLLSQNTMLTLPELKQQREKVG